MPKPASPHFRLYIAAFRELEFISFKRSRYAWNEHLLCPPVARKIHAPYNRSLSGLGALETLCAVVIMHVPDSKRG